MSEQNAATAEATNSALSSVAQAMSDAAAKVQDGASEVSTRVQSAMPATSRLVSRFTYSSCYFVSYGVVFPTLFLAHYIPGGNVIASGVYDGAQAAQDAMKEFAARKKASEAAVENGQTEAHSAEPNATT